MCEVWRGTAWVVQSVTQGLQAAGSVLPPHSKSLCAVGEPVPVAFPGGGSTRVPGVFQLLRLVLQVLGELYRFYQVSRQQLDLVVLLQGTPWERTTTLLVCRQGPSCPVDAGPAFVKRGASEPSEVKTLNPNGLLALTPGSQPTCVRGRGRAGEGRTPRMTVLVTPKGSPATPRPWKCALRHT